MTGKKLKCLTVLSFGKLWRKANFIPWWVEMKTGANALEKNLVVISKDEDVNFPQSGNFIPR